MEASVEVETGASLEEEIETSPGAAAHFSAVDYVLFSILLAVSMGVGVFYARARHPPSVSEYLMGGRTLPAVPVALSLIGGVVSALSILGNATEIYLYGTQLTLNLLGCIIGVALVNKLILPVLIPLNLVSVIQYLELRYQSRLLKRLITCCQLMSLLFYLGICLHAPSLALSSVTPVPAWASILFLGLVCTLYVSIGGARTVVYTDVVQTVLMFLGVVVVVVKCTTDLGGTAHVWQVATQGNRIEFFNLDPSPFTRHTLWSTTVLGVHFVLSYLALAQPQFQRLASVTSLRKAQWLMKAFLVGIIILWGFFYYSGLVAYATYSDCDPLTSGRIEKADQIIPYMVMDKLGSLPGLPGLFVAAIYGGVLSSMSSNANSVACLVWEDLLKDTTYFSAISPAAATNVVKLVSMAAGLASMGLAVVAGRWGNLFSVAYTVSTAIQGPVDGLFLTGIFVPWANKTGAVVGLVTSFFFSMWRVVGTLMRGGTFPPSLPLSTDGCPEILTSASSVATTTITPTTITDSLVSHETNLMKTHDHHTLYDVSYCYNGFIGIIITLVVSSVVSFCTRPLRPEDVDGQLLNSMSAKLYRRAWQLLKRKGKAEGEVNGLKMKANGDCSSHSKTNNDQFCHSKTSDAYSCHSVATQTDEDVICNSHSSGSS